MGVPQQRVTDGAANAVIARGFNQRDFHQAKLFAGLFEVQATDRCTAALDDEELRFRIVLTVMRVLRVELLTTERLLMRVGPVYGVQLRLTRQCVNRSGEIEIGSVGFGAEGNALGGKRGRKRRA